MSRPWSRFSATDGWHRVHWFRLLELLGQAALASLFLLSSGVPGSVGAWAEELFGLVMGLLAVANYLSTRYKITDDRITTTKGVFFRSEETMRRADVQTVSVLHPVWYRPLNLARVTIADDAGNEIDIGPVSRVIADRFASALQPVENSIDSEVPTTAHDQTSTPVTMNVRVTVPLWKCFLVTIGDLGFALALLGIVATGYFGSWIVATLIGVASFAVPLFEVVSMRRFRLVVTDDEIGVRDGIMTVSESRTTRHRSEYLRVDSPMMYRMLGVERVLLGNGDNVLTVAPVQPRGDWRGLVEPLLGVEPVDEIDITPIGQRSVRRFRIRGVALTVALGAVMSPIDWRLAIIAAATSGVVSVGWYPQARLTRFGLGTTNDAVVTRVGFAPRRLFVHRLDRIDSSVVSTTPGQRKRHLATVRFSGRSPASDVRVPDLVHGYALACEATITARRVDDVDQLDGVDSTRVQRVPVDLGREHRDMSLPASAVTAAVIAKGPWAAIMVTGWSALMVGVRLFDPPGSPWRSPWLLWAGTGLVALAVVQMLLVPSLRIRRERWSITNGVVERRTGLVITDRTTVKRSHVSAAKWSQGPVERRFGLGSVTLLSRGLGNPDLVLQRLDADEARELAELHRSRVHR